MGGLPAFKEIGNLRKDLKVEGWKRAMFLDLGPHTELGKNSHAEDSLLSGTLANFDRPYVGLVTYLYLSSSHIVINALFWRPISIRMGTIDLIHHRFPVKLPENCIKLHGRTGYDTTVLDPFSGFGSTALACLKSGTSFIGIETTKGDDKTDG